MTVLLHVYEQNNGSMWYLQWRLSHKYVVEF